MTTLRKLREAAGLTQAQLARRASVDRSTLCLAEIGQIALGERQRIRLHRALVKAARARSRQIEKVVNQTEDMERSRRARIERRRLRDFSQPALKKFVGKFPPAGVR